MAAPMFRCRLRLQPTRSSLEDAVDVLVGDSRDGISEWRTCEVRVLVLFVPGRFLLVRVQLLGPVPSLPSWKILEVGGLCCLFAVPRGNLPERAGAERVQDMSEWQVHQQHWKHNLRAMQRLLCYRHLRAEPRAALPAVRARNLCRRGGPDSMQGLSPGHLFSSTRRVQRGSKRLLSSMSSRSVWSLRHRAMQPVRQWKHRLVVRFYSLQRVLRWFLSYR
mmetsp:Transcript_12470/g.28683  ORF Transcript_12470/g.28683 Transcript_12470/m.28683 type:complete len:220 (+) Transcript_12470:3603-4262(+)